MKFSANSLVQDVVVEAASFFGLDPNQCELKHKRTTVAKSQLFRFANIPNNSTIDLVLLRGGEETSRGPAAARVAISIPEVGSWTETFDSSVTLLELLQSLVDTGKAPAGILSRDPEIIYMRNSYRTEKLESTTLHSLGLSG